MKDQKQIRLLLLDDHVLFRESLASLLASEPGFELAAQCGARSEALEVLLQDEAVDVVLLHIGNIDNEDRDSFISAARRAGYTGKLLIVTSEIDATAAARTLKHGVSGIFLDSKSSTCLIQAIRMVASGEAWVDQKVIQLLADQFPQRQSRRCDSLTSRERKVLEGILDGLTNKKIGNRIGVSEATIKGTLQQLFVKAGVRTRSQLVRAAIEGALEGTLRTSASATQEAITAIADASEF